MNKQERKEQLIKRIQDTLNDGRVFESPLKRINKYTYSAEILVEEDMEIILEALLMHPPTAAG